MKQLNQIYFGITLLMSVIFVSAAYGQSNNPAEASGYLSDSEEFWDNVPHLTLSPESENLLLPNEVDNSLLMYFPWTYYLGDLKRHLYIQGGNGACAAVSTVHYTLTYELNRVREAYGLYDENKCPANFTWNFLNDGNFNQGSYFEDNLSILTTNGCPSCIEWGNCEEETYEEDHTLWMHGYGKYLTSYHNHIEGYSQISPMYDPEKHELMKHWLANHNEGEEETGGLIVFSTSNACAETEELVYPSNYIGDEVIVEWGDPCPHAMTIVGYCDDVMWDFNGDGQYTNTIDLDENGIYDVRDYEIGAFIVVGLGDYDYAQEGFVWVMYKTIAETSDEYALVLHIDNGFEPSFEIKGQVNHSQRTYLTFQIGKGDNANSNPPSPYSAWKKSIFAERGGENPMQGIGNDPWMEFSINFFGSFTYPGLEFGKLFIKVKNASAATSDATLNYWSIVDRRWGEVFEIQYPETNIIIPPGPGTYQICAIPYHLIPHETYIEEDLNLFSDMFSRFIPTVGNGATLTVEDGVQIDMYNSEIHILQGSSLVIEDNAVFVAKDGNCKLVVDGNISVGSNVSFLTENGAQLIVEINNTAIVLSINNAHFNGAALIAYNDDLTVTGSDFTDGGIYGFNGDFDISNTEFFSSFIKISNADADNRLVTISGYCNFSGLQSAPAIYIDSYPNFKIDNCIINECSDAINLFNCGYGKNYQQISNCDITGNSATGITVYNTSVDILHNEIANNSFGIKCFNRSKVHIEGDSHEVTQEIRDNDSYEVYASRGSFPHYFHWNLIQDDNLPGDPKIYYSGLEDGLNVRNNCWGENELNPEVDLYPYESYIWDPVWNCLQGSGSGTGSDAEGMYLAGREKIEAEDYTGAKADFQQIIVQYPASKYAQAALKEIYSLEAFVTNDYTELKSYYNSEPNIVNNPELDKLADFLVNF